MKQPLVTIIIVTFNSAEYLEKCLNSIEKNKYLNFEIIVIDNGSSDETINILRQFKKVKVFDAKENLGYAGANNLGMTKAEGNFVFFLNPDTLVDKNFLSAAMKPMIENENVAAVQPLVYLFDKKTINLSGKVTHFLGYDWIRDYKAEKVAREGRIWSMSGSGVLVRRSTFEKVGGFDDFYFMYYEDTDLSWKFNLIGKKIVFTPRSILYHDYKYLPKEDYQPLVRKLFYIERNRLVTLLKNYSWRSLLIVLPALIITEFMILILALWQGWISTKLKTYFSILQNWSLIMEKRQKTQSLRTVNDKLISKHFQSALLFEKFKNPLVEFFVNPFLEFYWNFFKKLI